MDANRNDRQLHTELADRAWIDHYPDVPREPFRLLFLDSESHVGVFERRSSYEGDFSLFTWRDQQADRFALTMLQRLSHHEVRYRVSDSECGQFFDLCLMVDGAPRGASKYYSMQDWGQVADRDAAAARVAAWLEHRRGILIRDGHFAVD